MEELSGTAQALVFLLSLDEDKGAKIIEQFDEQELRQLRAAVDELHPVTAEGLDQIYMEFAQSFKDGLTTMNDGGRYLQELVRRVHGDEDASRLFSDDPDVLALPAGGDADRPLAGLSHVSPETLQMLFNKEHPQVAAAILAFLEPSVAAATLEGLEVDRQADVLHRMVTLKSIPRAALADAESAFGGLDLVSAAEEGDVDGLGTAADILKSMPSQDANDLLEKLSMDNPAEAVRLRQSMFTFEDLIDADNRGLQTLLREVQSDNLPIALKTASDELRAKFFSCMSSRAAEILNEEIEMLPPIRRSEVDNAQQQIVDLAMQLISEGRLLVMGTGEEMV